MKKKTSLNALSLFISIALVIFLLSQINIEDIKKTAYNFKPVFILIAFSFYLLLQFSRALRLKALIFSKDMKIWDLFKISTIHTLMNRMLPARSGELSYFFLLKKEKIKMAEGVATLVAARGLELVIALIFFLSTIVLLGDNIVFLSGQLFYSTVSILSFLVIFVILAVVLRGKAVSFLERMGARENIPHKKSLGVFFNKIKEIIDSLRSIRSKSRGFSMLIFTVLVFVCMYLTYFFLFLGLNIKLSAAELVFITTIPLFIQALPIYGFGGFGTTEGGYALSFIMLGMSKEMGIVSGFSINIMTFLFTFLIGLWGILLFFKAQKDLKGEYAEEEGPRLRNEP